MYFLTLVKIWGNFIKRWGALAVFSILLTSCVNPKTSYMDGEKSDGMQEDFSKNSQGQNKAASRPDEDPFKTITGMDIRFRIINELPPKDRWNMMYVSKTWESFFKKVRKPLLIMNQKLAEKDMEWIQCNGESVVMKNCIIPFPEKWEAELAKNKFISTLSIDGRLRIHIAAQYGDQEVLSQLLDRKKISIPVEDSKQENGKLLKEFLCREASLDAENIKKNVNCGDLNGNTPLFYAADVKVGQLLINAGACPNAVNNAGDTPLFYAADVKVGQLLIDAGACPNRVNNAGNTPLFYVNNVALAQLLIGRGGDINAVNTEEQNVFFYVKNPLVADFFLATNPLLIQRKDGGGNTVLFTAQNKEMVNWFIDHGINNIEHLNKRSRNALCMTKLEDVMEALIKNGADINKANKFGYTPVCFAVFDNNETFLRVLLKNKVKLQDSEGKNPLMLAYTEERPAMRKILEEEAQMRLSFLDDIKFPFERKGPDYIIKHHPERFSRDEWGCCCTIQ